MAEFLACPRCGEKVDENPESHRVDAIAVIRKELGSGQQGEFVFCPHCGAVLGVLPVSR